MPIIQHRTGPLAGQEQVIPEGTERIVFGRDPSVCDVVYPADLAIVARRHFALVRTLAREWVIDEFGKPFVAVNGVPATEGHLIERESPEASAKPVTVSRLSLRFKDGEAVKAIEKGKEIARRRVYQAVTLEPGVKNTFIVYAEQHAIVKAQLEGQSGTIARDDENSMYAVISYRPAADKTQGQLVVTGPHKDIGFQLLHYTWGDPKS